MKSVREWLFTPRPRFKDFEELNAWLADQCRAISRKRSHPEEKGRSIWEVFEEEQASLVAISAPFDGYAEKECRVSSTGLISYDRNQYSVESRVAGQTATVRASAGQILVIKNGTVVGEHVRQFGRDKTVYNPWHYLGILCAARAHGLEVVERACRKALTESTVRGEVVLSGPGPAGCGSGLDSEASLPQGRAGRRLRPV